MAKHDTEKSELEMFYAPGYYQRTLDPTEQVLVMWGLTERQAVLLARYVSLPAKPRAEQVEQAVTFALAMALQHAVGPSEVAILFAERRDTKRVI